jgi:hypothetical protein
MNKKQRYVLYACAAVILLMLLFWSDTEEHTTVDIGVLLVKWLGVMLAGAILWFAFRDRKEGEQELPRRDSEAEELRPEKR